MKRIIIAVLCLAGCHAASSSDPCASVSGTCVTLQVSGQGVSEVDQLSITVSGAYSSGPRLTPTPPKVEQLPLQVAASLAPSTSGTIEVAIAGMMAGREIGTGRARYTVKSGAHGVLAVMLTAAKSEPPDAGLDLSAPTGDMSAAGPQDLGAPATSDLARGSASDLAMLGRQKGVSCSSIADCAAGLFCSDGVCCESACNDSCHACNLPSAPGTCMPAPAAAPPSGHPACVSNGQCGNTGLCDGNGKCAQVAAGTKCGVPVCVGNNQISSVCDGNGGCAQQAPLSCAPYACDATPGQGICFGSCSMDSQCVSPNSCVNQSCGPKQQGAACGNTNECTSGLTCSDGVCCDKACGGCSACNLPGTIGSCKPIAKGQDPNQLCTGACDSECDGNGSCDVATKKGQPCGTASCSNATFSSSQCDGVSASCPAPVPMPCANHLQCASTLACDTSCNGDGDCVLGYGCYANTCDVHAPVFLAPLTAAVVTSTLPKLSVQLAPGTSGAAVDICNDRPCSDVYATADASGVPSKPLLNGHAYFWRARGILADGTQGTHDSPTWEFWVGANHNCTGDCANTSWQQWPDFNGDGIADIVVVAGNGTAAPGASGTNPPYAAADYLFLGISGSAQPISKVNNYWGTPAGVSDPSGYVDLVVTAPSAPPDMGSGNIGALTLYPNSSGKPLAGTPVTLQAPSAVALGSTAAALVANATGVSNEPVGVVSGDFNGDGYGDLAAVSPNHMLYIFPGSSTGLATAPTLTLQPPTAGETFLSVQLGACDVDGDGKTDIVAYREGEAYVFSGAQIAAATASTLTTPTVFKPNKGLITSLAAADLNGDGYCDVALGNFNTAKFTTGSNVTIFYSSGKTGIVSGGATTVLSSSDDNVVITGFGTYMAAVDLNSDGYNDLVIGAALNAGGGETLYFINQANNSFTFANSVSTYGPITTLGDVNGDHNVDFAIGDANHMNLFLSNGAATGPTTVDTMTLTPPGASNFTLGAE